jgi:hypothetical protein
MHKASFLGVMMKVKALQDLGFWGAYEKCQHLQWNNIFPHAMGGIWESRETCLRFFKWTHTLGVCWESKMFKMQFEGSYHL